MTIGTVNEFGRSQKGSAKVKIDGAWYFVGKCNTDGMEVGDRIEFESNVFGDRGNLHGLQTWKLVGPAPAKANGNAGAVSDDAEMRFCSNVVGSAIEAGLIKVPADIAKWFWGAKNAMSATDEEPPFNDEI